MKDDAIYSGDQVAHLMRVAMASNAGGRNHGWSEDANGTVRLRSGVPVMRRMGEDNLNTRGVNIVAERANQLKQEQMDKMSPAEIRMTAYRAQHDAVARSIIEKANAGVVVSEDVLRNLDRLGHEINPPPATVYKPAGESPVVTKPVSVPGSGSPQNSSSSENRREVTVTPDGTIVEKPPAAQGPSTSVPPNPAASGLTTRAGAVGSFVSDVGKAFVSLFKPAGASAPAASTALEKGVFQTNAEGQLENITGRDPLKVSGTVQERRNIYLDKLGRLDAVALDRAARERGWLEATGGSFDAVGYTPARGTLPGPGQPPSTDSMLDEFGFVGRTLETARPENINTRSFDVERVGPASSRNPLGADEDARVSRARRQWGWV